MNRFKLFAVCFSAMLLLMGCGSDSDPEGSPAPDSGQTDTSTVDAGNESGTDSQVPDADEDTGSDSQVPETGVTTGTLTVRVNNADGGFTVSDGSQVIANKAASDCPLSSGYFICNFELQTGPYLVEFTDVPDFITPDDAVASLTQAGITIDGNYEPIGVQSSATLVVGFDHADGSFTVTDFGGDTVFDGTAATCPLVGNYYTCSSSFPLGTYTVAFGDVPAQETPTDKHVTLNTDGETVEAYGDYSPATTYELTVGVNIEEGAFTVSHLDGGGQMQVVASHDAANCPLENGYYTCQMSLPLDGGYLVEFTDVTGFTTPDPIDVDLSQTNVTVKGDYAPL